MGYIKRRAFLLKRKKNRSSTMGTTKPTDRWGSTKNKQQCRNMDKRVFR